MSTITTNRPGVFSSYALASSCGGTAVTRYAAVVAAVDMEPELIPPPGWMNHIQNPGVAAALFATQPRLLQMFKLLAAGGIDKVFCHAVHKDAATDQWRAAFASALGQEDVYVLLYDRGENAAPAQRAALLPDIQTALETAAQARRERIALTGLDDPADALAAAGVLNSERMIICAPGAKAGGEDSAAIYCACGLAAKLLTAADVSASFSGAEMTGLTAISNPAGEEAIEAMLAGGVTPFEAVAGRIECIRAMTTRTKTGGVGDRTFAPVNTILIVDDIMHALRQSLRLLLQGAKNTPQGFEAIGSQVLVLLAAKKEAGLITDYSPPRVYEKPGDPSVCMVEVRFHVAFVVNQIHIEAYIQV